MSSTWFYEPFYEIDRLMNELVNQPDRARRTEPSDIAQRPYRPRMDLHENEKENRVTALFELPGLTPDQVNIEVHNGRLSVSGEVKKAENLDEGGFAFRERRCGKFSRTIQLPQGVEESEVRASMKDGVLTVTFPKATPEMAPKKISIS